MRYSSSVIFIFAFLLCVVAACTFVDDDSSASSGQADDDAAETDDDQPADDDSAPEPVCGLRQVVDLNLSDTVYLTLPDGTSVAISLRHLESDYDPVRGAIRRSRVWLTVNGESVWLEAGNYQLPVTVGAVQIDCPVTGNYYHNTHADHWGLRHDARLRIWPAGCPWFWNDEFRYPVDGQRWLSNRSQAGNEPTDDYLPFLRSIYYHSGVDLGGTDTVDTVIAAADGLVVLAHGEVLPGYEDTPAVLEPQLGGYRTDVVYLLDRRGWFYRYSHLDSIDLSVQIGGEFSAGDVVGVLGKGGSSGGWSHLHFEILIRQPSGEWGTEASYAYLWEAYCSREQPPLLAMARPHHIGTVGERITLTGELSRSFVGEIVEYKWLFTDGTSAVGEEVFREYTQPGFYTEVLQVTDTAGNVAYDFAVVQIVETGLSLPVYTYMHAVHTPSKDIRVGDEVLFKVRVYGIWGGEETWDFGDGSPLETTQSGVFPFGGDYASIVHTYNHPGDYLIRVERINRNGDPAIARLWVHID